MPTMVVLVRLKEVRARIQSADAALARLDESAEEEWVRACTATGAAASSPARWAYQRLSRELLTAQSSALVRLKNEGTISDEALHRIERDLAL